MTVEIFYVERKFDEIAKDLYITETYSVVHSTQTVSSSHILGYKNV